MGLTIKEVQKNALKENSDVLSSKQIATLNLKKQMPYWMQDIK